MLSLTYRIIVSCSVFTVIVRNVCGSLDNDDIFTQDSEEIKNDILTCSELPSIFQRNGSVNIGGLFSIHKFEEGKCSDEIDAFSLQIMYAMVYAIEKINSDPDLLTNVTLGFNIHDDCRDVNIAVRSSMDFIKFSSDCVGTADQARVGAVVGPMNSDAALSVASLLSLFKLPEISPFATSTDLSDKRYSYFLRNVPSDDNQMTALADIVEYFGWSSVAVLSTDDLGYGVRSSELLMDELQARNICVAYRMRFNAAYTDYEFSDVINNLRNLSNIKVLVSIADRGSMLKLLEVFAKYEMYGYTWLASEGWAWSPTLADDKYYRVVKGMLGLRIPSYNVPQFRDYLRKLKPDCQDPFLTLYWEKTHNCSLTSSSKDAYISKCNGTESFKDNDPFLNEALVSTVMDSVKVIALGLDACNTSNPEYLLECMKNVTLTNKADYRIFFKTNGDLAANARYDITNFQHDRDCRPIIPKQIVGTWIENIGLDMDESAIVWPTDGGGKCDQNWIRPIPESFCSADCDFGYRKETIWENICCWQCIPCDKTEYTNSTNALECSKCNFDEISNSLKNGCNKLSDLYLSPKTNIAAFITAIVSLLGITGNLFVLLVFIVKRQSTVVYNSCGKLYKFPLLVSIIFCLLFTCFFISPTTTLSCRIGAIIQFVPIILCQTILLLVCVVHMEETKRTKYYNLWIFIVIIFSYSCFMGVGYMVSKPGLDRKPNYEKEILIIGCVLQGRISCYSIAITSVLLLDIIGMTVAYRIKTKEGNFNEAKFIFYTFIAHSMLWVAVVLVKILAGNETHSKQLAFAFGTLGSAYIFLACIFFPKLNAFIRKAEARALVESAKPKRGWKFRRKNTKDQTNHLEEDSLIAAQEALLNNMDETIAAMEQETIHTKQIISMCETYQQEIRKRHSRCELELLDKLYAVRNSKAEIVALSKHIRTTRC